MSSSHHVCGFFLPDGDDADVGSVEPYEPGRDQEKESVKSMRATPTEPAFTLGHLCDIINALAQGQKRSAMALLTRAQIISGLVNVVGQDILSRARIHPRSAIADLTATGRRVPDRAIVETVCVVTDQHGRCDQYDLHDKWGESIRWTDGSAVDKPGSVFGTVRGKAACVGGMIYTCAGVQRPWMGES